jgi:Flp pilus assembly protein CpaB
MSQTDIYGGHMNSRTIVVILLLVVLVGTGAVLFLVNQQPAPDPNAGQNTGEVEQPVNQQPIENATALPTATPQEVAEIVIAVQDIPRGASIDANTVAVVPWPLEAIPENAVTNPEDVIGRIARTDLFREQPILSNLVVDDFQNLARVGSDAALITPPNRVLVAVPMNRLTSVAFAIQPGDRVDIIASLLFVDVDRTFQSAEPNQFSLISTTQDENGSFGFTTGSGIRGIFDSRIVPTNSGPVTIPVVISPSEDPRPRLSVQRTVQDALVIWLGSFPADGRIFKPAPSPTSEIPTATPDINDGGTGGTPEPTEIPNVLDIVTVAVSPQDAVVLTWFVEAKIPFTFALRSAATTTLPQTDAVTLDYIMERFNIAVPERFNYSIEPAIRSIRRLEVGDQITLQESNPAPQSPPAGQ